MKVLIPIVIGLLVVGCISMDPTRDTYPPTEGEEDPGGYKKYKHHIKPWIDAFGQKGEQPDKVSCPPISDVKVNPWYDYTHPWLKFTKNAASQAGVAVPEIAITEVKKRIGAQPWRKRSRGARWVPGRVLEDGNPPNPNDYAKWNDQDLAFNSWYGKTYWYFGTVRKILPQVLEDIKNKSQ